MKLFIAAHGFVQGHENPLKIPGSPMHVTRGAIIALDHEQMEHKDVKNFILWKHLLPMDSESGKQINLQCEKEKAATSPIAQNPKTDWHRAGALIGLAAILAAVLIYLLDYFLTRW
jgi:hypothetical protein